MVKQEIKIIFRDDDRSKLGTLLVSSTKDYYGNHRKFSEDSDSIQIQFKNVPKKSQPDQYIPIVFNTNKDLETIENILLLEETEYQLVFTPENSYINSISFPTLEKEDKNPVFNKINFNRNDIYGGIINFKSYAGKSFFDVEIDGKISLKCPFEVRSRKIDYINHYSAMIGDLAQAASSMILNEKSPLHRPLEFQERVKKSFYEDFMFLEYIFRPENLPSAYGHIKRDPHRILVKYAENVPLSLASSVGPSSLIDMAANPDNLIKTDELPPNWPYQMQNYVPQNIILPNYTDTLDTPENRFIKYFLTLLHELIIEMILFVNEGKMKGYPAEKILEYYEIIQKYVMDGWMDDVGKLNSFPTNSQVLQKKEGYREIFDYFLIFEFSFNFQFEEIKEEIKGYQKRLSKLYEYWCYLELIKIMSKLEGTKPDYSSIFDLNVKDWSIKVNEGHKSNQRFNINLNETVIEVELEFNRTFNKSDNDHYSYSLEYRPDYTLIINNDSERLFLHFDAKYKLNREKFKKEDVYKMHTYKDAIPGSLGAYVLYPGIIEEYSGKIYPEKDQILPSVGAFPLTPGKSNLDENKIESFLFDAINWITQPNPNN
ncbi:MAG: DUF2357 domain-containing protein [Methanobacteriaceae archaeon]|nr:DUF2357 domain-containing protein [Methanobacteriaceae archaeon]